MQGSVEARTQPYFMYGEGVLEMLTKQCAAYNKLMLLLGLVWLNYSL